jgi:hypothetical protein
MYNIEQVACPALGDFKTSLLIYLHVRTRHSLMCAPRHRLHFVQPLNFPRQPCCSSWTRDPCLLVYGINILVSTVQDAQPKSMG